MLETIKSPLPSTEFTFALPPFPATAAQLVAALNNDETHVRDIIALVECEPTISSRVLNIANSPLYGASRSITTIGHAVVILGFKSVSNLALTAAAGAMFDQGDCECQAIRQQTYYQSLAIGTLARQIAWKSKAPNPDESFLTGVMHDIGKLVLLNAAGTDYADLITEDAQGDTTQHESNRFGTTHPALGKTCGQKWGLPPSIVLAINNHHANIDAVTDQTSMSLIAANYAARCWGIGFDPVDSFEPVVALDDYITALDDDELRARSTEQYAAIREICTA
ncbi:HDOD domain-containing protein [Planctomycetes bacterium K23_9]|uniref:HDOD domain protein n=1 Tax=Stieleria marina TaxID=1930275 RepID=A0A517NVL4_9BACT|nr:HDOD domain protein [Planctomycetes bacterium K23_9]